MDPNSLSTPKTGKKQRAATRRERWSWYFYDFGNSAYAAVVLLAVYSAYFKGVVVGGAEGTRLWGISVGIAMFVVAIVSPILGALADFSASKKKMLLVFSIITIVFTALLFTVTKGDVFTGMLFFILAEIGYRSGQVFYNALLPEIAHQHEMGHVSGTGWAIGSFGGIICLLIVLALIMKVGGDTITRSAFLITAVFFAIASTPIFLFLRERNKPSHLPAGETYISVSLGKIWNTLKNVGQHRDFAKFLLAFIIFNCGIMITLDYAAIIGKTLFPEMTQTNLIIFMIIVQVTSVAGAFLFGNLEDRMGGRTSLVLALGVMIAAVAGLYFVNSLTAFYGIGALAGFALTGVQSVSRTIVGQLSPKEKAAEFFGLFSLTSQISNFIGPLLFGLTVAFIAFRHMDAGTEAVLADQLGTRQSVGLIIAFMLIGLVLLFSVKKWKQEPEGNV